MAKSKKKKKSAGKIVLAVFFVIILAFLAVSAVVGFSVYREIQGGGSVEKREVEISILPGDSVSAVASRLKSEGIIRYEMVFSYLAGRRGVSQQMKAGSFSVSPGMGYEAIFYAMTNAKQNQRQSVQLTFPEGFTVEQIIGRLCENGVGNAETYRKLIATEDFGYAYLPEAGTENRLEGYLYPDTYDFFTDEDEKSVLLRFLKNFDKKITENGIIAKGEELGMDLAETIKLASVVQAEGMVSSELPLISSVFHNRLEIGMKLESDATLNYTFPEDQKKWYLTYEDIRSDNPYNTYYWKGLPPTAIMNPGIEAIVAAVSPADTKYFYFCGVGDGSHVFAETYQEHSKNVDKYINNK